MHVSYGNIHRNIMIDITYMNNDIYVIYIYIYIYINNIYIGYIDIKQIMEIHGGMERGFDLCMYI